MFYLLKTGMILEIHPNDPDFTIKGNYLEYPVYKYDYNGNNEIVLKKRELILKRSNTRRPLCCFKKRYKAYLGDIKKWINLLYGLNIR